jgi:hypothetical protein
MSQISFANSLEPEFGFAVINEFAVVCYATPQGHRSAGLRRKPATPEDHVLSKKEDPLNRKEYDERLRFEMPVASRPPLCFTIKAAV